MKLAVIFASVLALPGNSWARPAAELEHTAETAVSAYALKGYIHGPGILSPLRKLTDKFLGNDLTELGHIVKSIPLVERAEFPFNQVDSESWGQFVSNTVLMNDFAKRFLSDEKLAQHFDPDGEEATKQLGFLVQYVKEYRTDAFGRVRTKTRKKAYDALALLIAFQHEYASKVGGTANNWELSAYYKFKLGEMMKKDRQDNL
jgi:hypothetical protein